MEVNVDQKMEEEKQQEDLCKVSSPFHDIQDNVAQDN